jgi:hypothetical protein
VVSCPLLHLTGANLSLGDREAKWRHGEKVKNLWFLAKAKSMLARLAGS